MQLPQGRSNQTSASIHYLPSQVTTQVQAKERCLIDNEMTTVLKTVLKEDKWFQSHENIDFIQDGLAWVGSKLYVLEIQRLMVLKKSHNSKVVGHFGFLKTLHLIKKKKQFWWPSVKKDIERM